MFKLINRLKNKKGFTLIELIVVLAVLGIIALIAIPRFLSVQAGARIDADNASAAAIAKAAELYYVQTGDSTIDLSDLTTNSYLGDEVTSNWQSNGDTPGYRNGITITLVPATGDVTIEDGTSGTKLEMYPTPDLPN